MEQNKKIHNILASLDKNLEIGDYNSVIFQCGMILEIIFKQIIRESLTSLPFEQRKKIMEFESVIGKGNKGFEEFTFGQICGLLRESNLLSKWAKYLNKDLGVLQSINLSTFVNLRNEVSHTNSDVIVDEYSAKLFHSYLVNWLAFLGIQDIQKNIKISFEKNTINKDSDSVEDKTLRVNMDVHSAYDSSLLTEEERLEVQSKSTLDFDLKILKEIFDNIGKSKINILDFGCASGKVSYDRFANISFVNKVIGIDVNSNAIKKAKTKFECEKMRYYELDILKSQGLEQLKEIMKSENIEQFDLIYCSFVLHHLENPKRALSLFRSLLKSNGAIFIKAADDQTKITYPDDNELAFKIIGIQSNMPTSSDRYFSRKMYSNLLKTGYKNIKMFYDVQDTINKTYEQKREMFIDDFSYRRNYVKQALDLDPNNKDLERKLEEIDNFQKELANLFGDYDFYYTNTISVAIGFK